MRAAFEASLGIGAKSLWSGSDMVLALTFPPGQTFAGDGEGFLPTALGHAKWPANNELARLEPTVMPDAGHGSYWGGDDPDYSRETARIAHEFLAIPDAIVAQAVERATPARALADGAAIPDRAIPARQTAQIC